MYLSKLEIHGFKSFAQKISLKFSDGLTAIVGPNGSGKTNIVDALRWVLGEQKSSVLRSDGMEQVIFNGTRTRKPLGMAEVSLTIENNKHILPTEYTQVVISRRLFRDGESTYLLNRTPCRLRDIIDLFTDTGMGADAYSVIELKMIEQILSDRSDERRHLFEEAAGIVKYKQRRKETLRKLSNTQNDLERVNDIIREVQKAVGSLSRQAEKAQTYSEVSANLKNEELALFRFEYSETLHHLNEISELTNAIRGERNELSASYDVCNQEYLQLEQAHNAVEKDLQRVLEQERAESAIVATARQELAVLRERMTSLQRDAGRIRQEKVSVQEQVRNLANDIASTEQRLNDLHRQKLEGQSELEKATQLRNEQLTQVQELREKVRLAAEPIQQLESRLHFLASGRERVRGQVNTSHEHRRQIAEQLQQSEMQRAEIHQRMEHTRQQLDAAQAAVQAAEDRLNQARRRSDELAAAIEELQGTLSTLREQYSHRQASLEFLQGLSEQSDSVNYLLGAEQWVASEKKLLSDCLSVDDNLRVAVESALGNAASYFVVPTLSEAVAARQALRNEDKGKASFICREAIPQSAAPAPLSPRDGVIGWASELVQCDDQLRFALRHILGKTLIVRDLDAALQYVDPTVDVAVTLDGEVATYSGIVRAGSVSKLEGVRLGKQHRIEQLHSECQQMRDAILESETHLQSLKAERGTIDVHAIADELRLREAAKASHEQSLNELHVRAESVDHRLEQLNDRMSDLSNENADFIREDENILRESEELRQKKAHAQAELDVIMNELHASEQNLIERENALRQTELAEVRVNTELQGSENSIHRLREQHSNLEQRFEGIDIDIQKTDEGLAECSVEFEVKDRETQELEEKFRVARAERVTIESQTQLSREALQVKADELKQLRTKLEDQTAKMHELEVNSSQYQVRVDEFIRRAAEEFEIELDGTAPMDLEQMPLEETRQRVHQLRSKLASMGAVNFLALEEHAREAERLKQLKEQYDDLIEAEKNLNDTIREINTTAKRLFQEVFDKVRGHFKELFAILFNNDGEADLQIVGDDLLEAQIEIMAKPKGKRPHSIEMLSGGEKTLTAIALLFAIYLVKPSPFCILDEVDAPLDDANIDRYLNLIRNFSKNTQFLMITHNKRTMEAADTLYGVTMEEVGVSKIVSVKLREGRELPLKTESDNVTEQELV